MTEDCREDRIAYGIEMITSLSKLMERDLPEPMLMLMSCLTQLLASELPEEMELRKSA